MSLNVQCLKRDINPTISDYKDTDLGLYVILKNDSVAFTVSDTTRHKILAVGEYAIRINQKSYMECMEELRRNETLLSPSFCYATRTFTIEDFQSTVIPQELYVQNDSRSYLNNLFHLTGREIITRELSAISGSVVLTAFNRSYYTAIQKLMATSSGFNFQSTYTKLITETYRIASECKRYPYHALINVRKKEFDLCIKNENGLLLLNTLPFPNREYMLYYFLYTLNKLKLDAGQLYLSLCGDARDLKLKDFLEMQVDATYYLKPPQPEIYPNPTPYDKYFIYL